MLTLQTHAPSEALRLYTVLGRCTKLLAYACAQGPGKLCTPADKQSHTTVRSQGTGADAMTVEAAASMHVCCLCIGFT